MMSKDIADIMPRGKTKIINKLQFIRPAESDVFVGLSDTFACPLFLQPGQAVRVDGPR
jgi:hypothetical protein